MIGESSVHPPGGGPAARPRRRRWFGLALLAAALAAGIGNFFYRSYVQERELQAAIDETDRLDPGWRLAELVERRPDLPEDQNSAPLIKKTGTSAITELNKGKVRENLAAITKELETLKPTVRLTGLQAEVLRSGLVPVAGTLAQARSLATWPRGRHPVNVHPAVSEGVPHVDHAGLLAWLLELDVHLRAQDGELAAAWDSCRALHNIARSFRDEPLWIAQSVGLRHRLHALRLLERVLAHGELPEKVIAATHAVLIEESDAGDALLLALRAHRAALHHLYTDLASGKASLAQVRQTESRYYEAPSWQAEVQGFFGRDTVKPAHAWLLRHFNRAVEIAKLPATEAEKGLADLSAAAKDAPALAQGAAKLDRLLSFMGPRRVRAHLACASAMLAVERYRLKHRRWPAALAEVVADGLLAGVPVDPYDDAPLRYRPTKDGVVVYSIGPDGAGAGDALERETDPQRLEFRLWNVDRRALRR